MSSSFQARIIVGSLQAGPEDPLPSPVVAVSFDSLQEAIAAAKLLFSVQNGSKPFASGPPTYMGDTRIIVRFLGRPDGVLCTVEAKSHPKHLTWAFCSAGLVSNEQFIAFRKLLDLAKSYVLTVAHGERVLTDDLYLVKYAIEERRVPS